KRSHEAHSEWYELQYATDEAKNKAIELWEYDNANQTINNWIHKRQLELTGPFVREKKSWLTVGDGYGFDASYFFKKGLDSTASDIAGTFLPLSKERGFIEKYAVENVERLT